MRRIIAQKLRLETNVSRTNLVLWQKDHQWKYIPRRLRERFREKDSFCFAILYVSLIYYMLMVVRPDVNVFVFLFSVVVNCPS